MKYIAPLIFLLSLGIFQGIYAQEIMRYRLENDSLFTETIELEEVYVLGPLRFEDDAERVAYLRHQYRVFKVYKYALMASHRLDSLKMRLSKISSKRKQRAYTIQVKDYLQEELTEELKKLSRSDGRVLIALIDRQTGISAFDLVKDYRNGFTAFWYQTAAKLYDMDLKSTYNPYENRLDYWTEDILQRAYLRGLLKYEEAFRPVDLKKMEATWLDQKKRQKETASSIE
ncbi:MAG: hypothetical protein RLZZ242_234 [Bacteroidota bacterium]|jgi:hypothetical protein